MPLRQKMLQNTAADDATEHTTASQSSATEHAKWQVKFPSGWQDLPTEASCKIEAARNAGEHSVKYEQCRFSSLIVFSV